MAFETLAGIIHAEVKERHGQGAADRRHRPAHEHCRSRFDGGTAHGPFYQYRRAASRLSVGATSIRKTLTASAGRTRYHDLFKPAGTNVNFIQIQGQHKLRIRTYERGVEGETLACGTGSVAAALVAGSLGMVSSPVAGHDPRRRKADRVRSSATGTDSGPSTSRARQR